MSSNPESQRARRAAGWPRISQHVPPELFRDLRGLAGAYGFPLTALVERALWWAAQEAPRDLRRRLGNARPFRLRRRDAGLCGICRARLRARKGAASGGDAGASRHRTGAPNTPGERPRENTPQTPQRGAGGALGFPPGRAPEVSKGKKIEDLVAFLRGRLLGGGLVHMRTVGMARKAGYPEGMIQEARAIVTALGPNSGGGEGAGSPSPDPVSVGVAAASAANRRCQALTRTRAECGLRAVKGTRFCRHHQRKGIASA